MRIALRFSNLFKIFKRKKSEVPAVERVELPLPDPDSPALRSDQAEAPPVDLSEAELLEVCKVYCRQLALTEQDNGFLQKQWQKYYDRLKPLQKMAIWRHANDYLPYVKNIKNTKLINLLWSRIFYSPHTVKRLARGSAVKAKKGFGLVYCYLINGKVRYVGQTREKDLYWRMTKRQESDAIGYNVKVKSNILNAYRKGRLSIQTKLVPLSYLDHYEKGLIKYYAPTNFLWNVEHNDHFQVGNYDVVI